MLRTSRLSLILIIAAILIAPLSSCHGRSEFDVQLGRSPVSTSQSSPLPVPAHTLSYILFDPQTGTIIDEHNRRLPLIPASTTKVLTVGTALHLLGPDYRFETVLGYRGEKGKGDLMLLGGEDPELKVRDLLAMIERLRHKYAGQWTGRFLFSEEPSFHRNRIDEQMEEEAAYNPSLSSLSLESNILYLRWKKPLNGSGSELHLIPSLPGIALSMEQKEADAEDEREIVYAGQGEAWTLRRPKQPEGLRPIPVKDAGLYTARVFQQLARTRGIHLPDPVSSSSLPPSGGKGGQTVITPESILAVHKSRPLSDIAERILSTSDNAMTELLLLHMAKKQNDRPMPLQEAASFLASQIRGQLPGLDWQGFQLRNGSGLTSENRISAEQLLAVLLYADSIKGGIEPYLPIGGWTPGLLGRLNHPGETFRVVAKAGGIYYSVTLTGFIYPESGRRLAFAILISDLDLRRSYEEATDRRSRKRSNEARYWMQQNRESLDAIVSGWLRRY